MKYAQLDNAIMEAIRAGKREFYLIESAVRDSSPVHPLALFRVVDRRLQALRKRGVIQYRRKEWHIAGSGE